MLSSGEKTHKYGELYNTEDEAMLMYYQIVNYELGKISFIVWQVLRNDGDYDTQDSKNLMKMGYFFLRTHLSLLLISI